MQMVEQDKQLEGIRKGFQGYIPKSLRDKPKKRKKKKKRKR